MPGSGVRASGPLRADRTPSPLVYAPLDLSLPVYPAGPVTLRLPIAWEGSGPRAVDLRFTYMACTASTCMPPVVGKQLRVTLPAHSSGR